MATEKEPTTIKKYANRRLYNTATSCYVTLDYLARLVKAGEDFAALASTAGWSRQQSWVDPQQLFSVSLFNAK